MKIMVEEERFGWEALGYSPLCCEPLSAAGEVAVEAKVQVSVQGRLKSHAAFWLEELDPSEFVANIVTSGYRLLFIALPDPIFQKNHRSAFENFSFVSATIEELVGARLIECAVQPRVCSPLQVVFNSSGKARLVLDLRYINQYLLNQKFKYEGLDLVPAMFERNNYFFTFDLKSGYHHIDIHTDCWIYLGLSWSNKL